LTLANSAGRQGEPGLGETLGGYLAEVVLDVKVNITPQLFWVGQIICYVRVLSLEQFVADDLARAVISGSK